MTQNRSSDSAFHKIESLVRHLPDPASYYSGLKFEDVALADNIVLFKRTSAEELKPKGVTHSYHHRFVLLLPLLGAGSVHVDGQSHRIAPGQFFLVFPHQFHRYHDLDPNPICWLFITFESRHLDRLEPLRNQVRRLSPANTAFLEQGLDRYLAYHQDEKEILTFTSNLSHLLHGLLKAPAIAASPRAAVGVDDTQSALVSTINQYIRAHLDQPLTLSDLARHMNYSESHLSAIFRQVFGVSLGKYMRHSRLSVAAAMLSQPDRPSIEKIATACGFESIFVFSRAFKAAMGMSPRAYCRFVQEGGQTEGPRPIEPKRPKAAAKRRSA